MIETIKQIQFVLILILYIFLAWKLLLASDW